MTAEQLTLVGAEDALLVVLRDRRSLRANDLIKRAQKVSDESEVNLRGGLWSLIARGKAKFSWDGDVTLNE